jgi:hypothetical protein
MKAVRVGGQERSADLLPAIGRDAAAARAAQADPADERVATVLSLRECASEAAFDARFGDLLRYRSGLDTEPFPVPRRPGLAGRAVAAVKAALWKLLRYQHDRMAFQQSAWNHGAASALEFERAQWRRELADLERRVRDLESGRAARAGSGEKP